MYSFLTSNPSLLHHSYLHALRGAWWWRLGIAWVQKNWLKVTRARIVENFTEIMWLNLCHSSVNITCCRLWMFHWNWRNWLNKDFEGPWITYVYGFGMTFYEVFTGKLLYEGTHPISHYDLVLNGHCLGSALVCWWLGTWIVREVLAI
jgi:hypothetical protein